MQQTFYLFAAQSDGAIEYTDYISADHPNKYPGYDIKLADCKVKSQSIEEYGVALNYHCSKVYSDH